MDLVRCRHAKAVNVKALKRFVTANELVTRVAKATVKCSKCAALPPDLWICLHCHSLNCGRTAKQHSLKHHERHPRHALCMNLSTRMIWCYGCDDEIIACTDESLAQHERYTMADQLRECLEGKTAEAGEDGSGASDASDDDAADGGQESAHGRVGLSNMGNTCFMNAALQALSNVPQVSLYFNQCAFSSVRSTSSKPMFASHFAVLVQSLWAGRYSALRPTQVYRALCRLNNSFAGFGQHDSHEAIRFIVNALHDELSAMIPKVHEPGRLRVDDVSEGPGPSTPKPKAAPEGDGAAAEVRGAAPADGGGASERKAGSTRTAGGASARSSKVEEDEEGELEAKGGGGGSAHAGAGAGAGAGAAVGGAQAATYSSSVISDLFGGVLLSQVKCLACRTVSTTRDRFYDLQLSIPPRPLTTPPEEASRHRGFLSSLVCTVGRWFTAGDIRIEDCLQNFCQRERLTGQERYYCESCKTRQDADKHFSILKLPDVLCLALKRFRHDSYWTSKVSTHVQFPLEGLDMAPFLASDTPFDNGTTTYELASIVRHIGGMNAGHYVSYAKNRESGLWYKFDDSHVTRVSPERVARQEAYVLFFRRQAPDRTAKIEPVQRLLQDGPEVGYVSKYWWLLWTSHCSPGPPRVSELVCEHGNLKCCLEENVARLVVPLSAKAVAALQSEFGADNVQLLHSLTACPTCSREAAELARQRQEEQDRVFKADPVNEVDAVADEGPGALPWFIIASDWLAQWNNFIYNDTPRRDGSGRGAPRPGPVSNHELLDEDGNPKPDLVKVTHYRGVNKLVWNEFMKLYGGGPTIRRAAINIYDQAPAVTSSGHADAPDAPGYADADASMDGEGGDGYHSQSQPMHYEYDDAEAYAAGDAPGAGGSGDVTMVEGDHDHGDRDAHHRDDAQ